MDRRGWDTGHCESHHLRVGMAESIIDVTDLLDGESVPIFKMKGDWRLDIGLPAVSVPKTIRPSISIITIYLRLFLLTMDDDTKLNRVEDLIQLILEIQARF